MTAIAHYSLPALLFGAGVFAVWQGADIVIRAGGDLTNHRRARSWGYKEIVCGVLVMLVAVMHAVSVSVHG